MDLVLARHSNRADLLLAAMMSTLVVFTGWVLLADIPLFVKDETALTDRPLAGTVTTTANAVRRRAAELPLWDGAAVGDELRLRDHVFTDEGANATLTLTDGTTLELGENTLIAMETAEDRPILNIIKGTIRAKNATGKTPVQIKVDGKKTLIKSSPAAELTVKVGQDETAEVTVWSGSAAVGSQQVGAMEALAIKKTAQAPRAVDLRLLGPPHGATFRVTDAIELAWTATATATGGEASLTLRVARDPGFRHLVSTSNVRNAATLKLEPLEPGAYYWRVDRDAGGGQDEAGEVRRFSVATPAIPRLLAPAPGQTFDADGVRQANLDFAWAAIADHRGTYALEVARDADFKDRVLTKDLPSPYFQTEALGVGEYFWRVRGPDGWSSASRFSLLKKPPPPVAPKLKSPSLPKRMEILIPLERRGTDGIWPRLASLMALFESTAYADDDAGYVRWEAVEGAAAYEVEVASDAGFQHVIMKKQVKEAAVEVRTLPPGTYFLRLATISADGVVGTPSEASTLVIAKRQVEPPKEAPAQAPEPLKPPVMLAPVDGMNLRLQGLLPIVSFSWKSAPKAATYAIQVLDARDSVVFERQTRGQDANAELKAGSYSWRVRALRSKDDQDSPWSKSVRFSVTHVLPDKQAEPPAVQKPPASPEPTPEPKPRARPGLELALLHAPSSLRYESTAEDPEVRIKALLLNSFEVRSTYWVRSWMALSLDGQRTSTVLFSDAGEPGAPAGQRPVTVKPYHYAAGLRFRVLGDVGTCLDVRTSFARQRLDAFERASDSTLSVQGHSVQGPGIGVEGALSMLEWTTKLRFDYLALRGSESGDESNGTTLAGSGLLAMPVGASGATFEVGFKAQLDRVGQVRMTRRSLLWGLGLDLR